MGVSNSMTNIKGKVLHPTLKEVTIIEQQGLPLILTSISVPTYQAANQFKVSSRILEKFSQELLFSPITINIQDQGYCGTHLVLRILYPHYPFNLDLEIRDRRVNGDAFKSQELWYLLGCLVKVGRQFEKVGLSVGAMKPSNILLNGRGDIKVITQYSLPLKEQDLKENSKVYLPPEALKAPSNSQNPRNSKWEVFSAAVIVIEAATLQNIASLYPQQPHLIDLKKLSVLAQTTSDRVSPLFTYILQKMIAQDPIQRPFFHEISSLLSPYSPCIDDAEPFAPNARSSFENLKLFYSCFESFKSHAFNHMMEELSHHNKQNTKTTSSELRFSERITSLPKRSLMKPFLSEIHTSPPPLKAKNVYLPLYKKNYQKLQKLERKREQSQPKACLQNIR